MPSNQIVSIRMDGSKANETQENLSDSSVRVNVEEDNTNTKRVDSEQQIPTFTHSEAMTTAQEMLSGLIMNDPMLRDLDQHVTLEEVNSMIALEYGQAMVVNIRRQDNEVIPIVVQHSAKVIDLKHAFKRHFTLRQSRKGIRTRISWRYVWKRHWLCYDGQKLMDDNRTLKSYGIHNRDSLTFIKRLRNR